MLWIEYRAPTVVEFCDDFNRADPLGANWVNGPWGVAGHSITGNQISSSGTGLDRASYWATDLGTVNHWGEIDVINTTGDANVGILLRCNASTNTNYMARYGTTLGDWEIFRRVTGTFTKIANTGTPDPSVPYRIRFESENSGSDVVLRLYEVVAGTPTLRLSFTDTSGSKITAGNFVGMRCVDGGTGEGVEADNFCCGPL